ncbi:MAG: hypothetical protein QF732_02950 [Nitrospinaceae bacterium]|nr:hypothetical protein [Nitrospinaceae bacterium]
MSNSKLVECVVDEAATEDLISDVISEFRVFGSLITPSDTQNDSVTNVHAHAPKYILTHDKDTINEKSERLIDEILKESAECLPLREEFHRLAPSHIREGTAKTKNFVYLARLLERFKYPDRDISRQLRLGFDYDKSTPPSGMWLELADPELERRISIMQQHILAREHEKRNFNLSQLRSRPPSFMTDENIARMYREWELLSQKIAPLLNKLPKDEINEIPIYLFGVVQRAKLRPCADFRAANKTATVLEKMTMPNITKIMSLCQMLTSGVDTCVVPKIQTRSHIGADVSNEKFRREMDQQRKSIDSFLNPPPLFQPGEETPHPFIPAFTKKDFSKYYFQLQPSSLENSTLGIWDPNAESETDSDKSGAFAYFQALCLQFGSVHSVFSACRFSLALSWLSDRFLLLVNSLYVDDSVMQSRPGCRATDERLLETFYSAIGLTMSVGPGKDENTDLGDIKILGIEVSRSDDADEASDFEKNCGIPTEQSDAFVQFALGEERTTEVNSQVDTLIEKALCAAPIILRELQGTLGYLNFCYMLDASRMGRTAVKELYALSDQTDFRRTFSNPCNRTAFLFCLRNAKTAVDAITPVRIHMGELHRDAQHRYSDAAIEDGKSAFMGGWIPAGPLFPENLAWSLDVVFKHDIPLWFRERANMRDIHLWEAMALMVNHKFSRANAQPPKTKSKHLCVDHIDNLGANYSLVKGYARAATTSAVLINTNKESAKCHENNYSSWIYGGRNNADIPSRPKRRCDTVLSKIGIAPGSLQTLSPEYIDWPALKRIVEDIDRSRIESIKIVSTKLEREKLRSASQPTQQLDPKIPIFSDIGSVIEPDFSKSKHLTKLLDNQKVRVEQENTPVNPKNS